MPKAKQKVQQGDRVRVFEDPEQKTFIEAVVEEIVTKDGRITVTIDQPDHEKHGKRSVVGVGGYEVINEVV